MAVYPAQLTVEEKNLKKRYAKLLEKRKQLLKSQEKPLLKSSSTKPSGEILSPRDAMAAAKKLLEAGKLKLGKKNPVKKTGFKRVGETPNDAPPAKKASTVSFSRSPKDPIEQQQQQLKQKKVVDQIHYQKSLYKRTFVKGSTARDIERIPKKQEDDVATATTDNKVSGTLKERTVYVRVEFGPVLSENALQKAFSRFGEIDKIELRTSAKSAFVSFVSLSCASAAARKMNRGMIRGYEVIVQPAGDENHFVELAGEAASNPWAVIAAGKEVSAPVKKAQSHRTQKSYENNDF
ncbi:uncharacterized protein LOC135342744 [Halichondria panicea]|uniref:uncharacterized protein LOC135342744 n=1 Tax=Halichondria panicea TaxID=6063 RepID=UPI00312B571C